ncbi:MAG: acyl-ACP--UDP-N-acetylglucosamine O-acyltransferase [Gammaproteobacteria bacterium]|nr:MAG: acyl-ACP--UDP-N-acetylglucosamine O-acyltransferase [Gammaproteobacteria bacterium]
MAIHPQAIVDPRAELAPDVEVGPFSVIGPDVSIDSGTVIHSHVVVKGPTHIGKHNEIFQFASVGEACQDKKYKGEPTRLEIGDHNVIRENCTLHRGTVQDEGVTRIGSHNLLMAYVHVAHDCVVGNHTVLANMATLAGHVVVDDHVILGGGTMVHQFCHIGVYAMAAGGSIVLKDIPAFVMASGQPAAPHGLNVEGLKRKGFDSGVIRALRNAYKRLYRQGLPLEEALATIEAEGQGEPMIRLFVDSVRRNTRGIIR